MNLVPAVTDACGTSDDESTYNSTLEVLPDVEMVERTTTYSVPPTPPPPPPPKPAPTQHVMGASGSSDDGTSGGSGPTNYVVTIDPSYGVNGFSLPYAVSGAGTTFECGAYLCTRYSLVDGSTLTVRTPK